MSHVRFEALSKSENALMLVIDRKSASDVVASPSCVPQELSFGPFVYKKLLQAGIKVSDGVPSIFFLTDDNSVAVADYTGPRGGNTAWQDAAVPDTAVLALYIPGSEPATITAPPAMSPASQNKKKTPGKTTKKKKQQREQS